MRAAAGQRDPWNVRYWGVGNESWGCGGSFTPEEYAVEYRRFMEWVPRYGLNLAFIGSGPNSGDLSWSRRFFGRLAEKGGFGRSEEHTSELQSLRHLVCRLLLEKKKKKC